MRSATLITTLVIITLGLALFAVPMAMTANELEGTQAEAKQLRMAAAAITKNHKDLGERHPTAVALAHVFETLRSQEGRITHDALARLMPDLSKIETALRPHARLPARSEYESLCEAMLAEATMAHGEASSILTTLNRLDRLILASNSVSGSLHLTQWGAQGRAGWIRDRLIQSSNKRALASALHPFTLSQVPSEGENENWLLRAKEADALFLAKKLDGRVMLSSPALYGHSYLDFGSKSRALHRRTGDFLRWNHEFLSASRSQRRLLLNDEISLRGGDAHELSRLLHDTRCLQVQVLIYATMLKEGEFTLTPETLGLPRKMLEQATVRDNEGSSSLSLSPTTLQALGELRTQDWNWPLPKSKTQSGR